jgi:predicted nuclease of predicted toxin-antitoxin system
MIRFVADENFNNHIVRGLLLRNPEVDIVRIHDVGLSSADDPTILEWTVKESRILLTHDVETMPDFAYTRVRAGLPIPAIFIVDQDIPIGQVIDDLSLIVECSEENEWDGQIHYLPL